MPPEVTDAKDIRVVNIEPTAAQPDNSQAPPASVAPTETTPATPTPPVAQVTEPVKPSHPRALIQEALYLGGNQAWIDAQSTDELYHAVQQEKERRWKAQQPAPQPVQPQQAAVDPDSIDWGDTPEADVAPAIVRVIKKQHKELNELRKVKDELGQLKQQSEERAKQQFIDAVDAAIDSVGADYIPILGKPGEMTAEQVALVNTAIAEAKIDPTKDNARAIQRKVAAEVKRLYGRFVTPAAAAAKPAEPKKTNGDGRITPEQFAAAATAIPTRKGAETPYTTMDSVDQWLRANNHDLGD